MSQNEETQVARVNSLFESMKMAKQEEAREVEEDLKFERGEQIQGNVPQGKVPIIINLCKKTILRSTALLSQLNPVVKVTPIDDDNEEFADTLGSILDTVMRNVLDYKPQLRRTAYNMAAQGTIPWRIAWDSRLPQGGDFVLERWGYKNFFAEDVEDFRNCKRFMLCYPEDINILKYQYGKEVQPETFLAEADTSIDNRNKNSQPAYFTNPDASKEYFNLSSDNQTKNNLFLPQRALKKIYWDFSDPERYPNGRVTITAGNTMLKDISNPWKSGLSDIILFINELRANTFWGMSDIRNLRYLNRVINRQINQMLDNVSSNGNAMVTTDDPLFNLQQVTTNPRKIYRRNRGTSFDRTPGYQIPGTHFELFNVIRGLFDSMSGLYDAMQGRPIADASGRAIIALQRASQVLIDFKATMINESLTAVAKFLLPAILQQYTLPRRMRIAHKGQSFNSINEYGNPNSIIIPDEKRDLRYDVTIDISADMPHNREFWYQSYRDLYSMPNEVGKPMIPSEYVIRASGIPDADKIVEQKKQEAQMMIMAQIQQQ